MKVYLIGGLGADKRVFKYLSLDYQTQVIDWITPHEREDLKSYCTRLLVQINQKEKFGILGVSFGGIIATELSKLCKPEILFLISSAESKNQLSKIYLAIGKTRILNLIPTSFIKPPKILLGFLFGTSKKSLLKEIIKDTDPEFIRWSLSQIINWTNISNENNQSGSMAQKTNLFL